MGGWSQRSWSATGSRFQRPFTFLPTLPLRTVCPAGIFFGRRVRKNLPVVTDSMSFWFRHFWNARFTNSKLPNDCGPRKTSIFHHHPLSVRGIVIPCLWRRSKSICVPEQAVISPTESSGSPGIVICRVGPSLEALDSYSDTQLFSNFSQKERGELYLCCRLNDLGPQTSWKFNSEHETVSDTDDFLLVEIIKFHVGRAIPGGFHITSITMCPERIVVGDGP